MANLGYLQVVRRCNQHCRFCSNPPTGGELELGAARAAIDDFCARGYYGVVLTGGEPSLWPWVVELCRYARERGLAVRMITNGSRLGEPGLLASYLEAGLRHFHVSVQTCRASLGDGLSGVPGSVERAMVALGRLGEVDATVHVNTVIGRFNADHLDETVRCLTGRFPFVRHYVWNNLDPSLGLGSVSGDAVERLRDLELALSRGMRHLHATGRSFRVERVPLCFMTEFADCSTETRKIVKAEERIVRFLDDKGLVRQTDFRHTKAEACHWCPLDDICAGLFEHYDRRMLGELHPVFVHKERVVERLLGEAE
jgi:MoaA/NifB/PqqE/SkfB family radical SAM enzyme